MQHVVGHIKLKYTISLPQASVRCLTYRGRFLEIGKFDISNNTPIGMHFLLKETSFHGIMLDFIFNQSWAFRRVKILLTQLNQCTLIL